MLKINATITNKSQLKPQVKILWAVFDPAVGRFVHPHGPFWMQLRAVLDISVGRFGPGLWAVLVHGPFWSFPVQTTKRHCAGTVQSQGEG